MTLKEAYTILKQQKYPKKPTSCVEFKSCFVFHFGGDKQFDSSFSINKSTKKVSPFIPISLPKEEYANPVNKYSFNKN